jgi:UDP-GlcNAc:undecaprenyl-phosphate GlcNAc-1-phosphate transferase
MKASWIIGSLCSCLCVFLQIPVIIKWSKMFGLYDNVATHRKEHASGLSRLGGVGIFTGFLFGLLSFGSSVTWLLIPGFLVLFLFGLLDDILSIGPVIKMTGLILSAILLISIGNFRLLSLHGIFGLGLLNIYYSWSLTIFIVVFVSSSFNLIDGIDGLAAAVGVLVHFVLAILLAICGDEDFAFFAVLWASAIAGFMFYNISPARIFMGDSGAMTIGLSAAILCIRYFDVSHMPLLKLPPVRPEAMVFALLILPLFDSVRVLVIRAWHRKPLFLGDRNHLHHRLKYLGLSDNETVLLLLAFHVAMILLVVICKNMAPSLVVLIEILICFVVHYLFAFLSSFKQ